MCFSRPLHLLTHTHCKTHVSVKGNIIPLLLLEREYIFLEIEGYREFIEIAIIISVLALLNSHLQNECTQ